MARTHIQVLGQRLSGLQRLGTPEQVAAAERELAVAYLQRAVDEALKADLPKDELKRLGLLLTGGAE